MSFLGSNTRLVLAVLLFLSVIFTPIWVSAIIALALALRFRAWEVVVAGLLVDLMWMPTSVSIPGALPIATLTALALVVVFEPLRRHLLIYSR
jgi:hypothetical protein